MKEPKYKVAYIIGAGASMPYEMPSGSELKEKILTSLRGMIRDGRDSSECFFYTPELIRSASSLLVSFSSSPTDSIDAHVNENEELAEVGKLMIAKCIREAEISSTIDETDTQNHWLKLFFNRMELYRYPERLKDVVFISFNYDRIIERFFDISFKSSFLKKENEEIADLMKNLNIIRIHGSLGEYDAKPYDDIHRFDFAQFCHAAASSLKLVDERTDSDAAKEALSQSEKIVFLGLGFDHENLQKIRPSEFYCPDLYITGTAYEEKAPKRKKAVNYFCPQKALEHSKCDIFAPENIDCYKLIDGYEVLPEYLMQIVKNDKEIVEKSDKVFSPKEITAYPKKEIPKKSDSIEDLLRYSSTFREYGRSKLRQLKSRNLLISYDVMAIGSEENLNKLSDFVKNRSGLSVCRDSIQEMPSGKHSCMMSVNGPAVYDENILETLSKKFDVEI